MLTNEQEIPETLKPYLFHGLNFIWNKTKKDVVAECPFCGKTKFSVKVEMGSIAVSDAKKKVQKNHSSAANPTSAGVRGVDVNFRLRRRKMMRVVEQVSMKPLGKQPENSYFSS